MSEVKQKVKESLNLPQTEFPIRANLKQLESALLQKWEAIPLYPKLQENQKTYSETYTLHDGPPYPNGNIHMGHALNKILKDIVVRSRMMFGKKVRFVPGWDCHGLPIEVQVIKELKKTGQEAKKHDITWFRQQCQNFALKYVNIQKQEFQELGILGEWDHPYLTLDKAYEAEVIRLFGEMAENNLIYKGRKPIHWCSTCETALAEAEIEYEEKRSPSIYVKFDIHTPSPKLAGLIELNDASLVVWTTTPWTLPANVAVAAHPHLQYIVLKSENHLYVIAEALHQHLRKKMGWVATEIIGSLSGKELEGTITSHPFLERTAAVVTAHYITHEDGTGFVHIAPGHGYEDYLLGLEYKLPMMMPVDKKGCFTDDTPWKGVSVWEANKLLTRIMEEKHTLMKLEFVTHSYPHCWRCKNPVIFRATEQWFVSMDRPMKPHKKTLRERVLEAIGQTQWYPAWGENRIRSMVENRPDWCVSRQRFWGIPIPVFLCRQCGHPNLTGVFNKAVVSLVKEEGALAWFSKPSEAILPSNTRCSQCDNTTFDKEQDILDVWFESGASFAAVLGKDNLTFPADLYLEGSDQHRGWFQSALLVGLGSRNHSPFKSVLTHGFLVDASGKKMSKSEGNVISPQQVIQEYGSDILRWWVASAEFRNDISLSKNILNQTREAFSKIRNTLRFCLSNLYDFNAGSDLFPYENLNELDQTILSQVHRLIEKIRLCYENFEFHKITHYLHDFCAVDLSALYLDMVKDRLYCGERQSKERKSTQTALYHIVDALTPLLAPILVFTAEDIYHHFKPSEKFLSIHLQSFPNANPLYSEPARLERWKKIVKIRETVYQQLEKMRNEKVITSFLEAEVDLTLPEDIPFSDWESFFIVSKVNVRKGPFTITVSKASGNKCERCWKYLELENGFCERCRQVLEHLKMEKVS